MVGFAGFARKLRIKPDHGVAVVNAPPECASNLPAAVGLDPNHAGVVIGFAAECADLALLTSLYAAALGPRPSALDARPAWLGYPRPGRLGTDLHRDWLARAVRGYRVQAVEHLAIDDTWSALLLRPAPDYEPDTFTADIAWPRTPSGVSDGRRPAASSAGNVRGL